MVTTLDRIISLIEHTMPLPWSSEADHGLTLLQNYGIKFCAEGDRFKAWREADPDVVYYASNGLLAGCRCYLAMKAKELK